MQDSPTRFVIIALALTGILLLVAGDRWNERIGRFHNVSPAAKGGA